MPTPSVPSPRTWASGNYVTVPRLRADVANAVAFLSQRPMFIGQNSTGASWSSGAANNLGLNAELADQWSMHATSGQVPGAVSSQIFAVVAGWYLCRAVIPVDYSSATAAQFQAGFNWVTSGVTQSFIGGASYIGGVGSGIVPAATDLIEQVTTGTVGGSGDYIQPVLSTSSNAGSGVSLDSSNLPTVSVRWACAISGTEPLPIPPLTAVPSPVTAAWMNANVRDTIRFLVYPPVCKAYYTAGSSSMASGSITSPSAVVLNTIAVDNYGGFSTSTYKYTAPVAGRYFLYGQFNLGSTTGTFAVGAGLSVNGGTTQWGDIPEFTAATGLNPGASVTRRLRLNAGDTVQLMGFQASGSGISYPSGAGNQSRLIAVWEGI